jgi:hypothetical protein
MGAMLRAAAHFDRGRILTAPPSGVPRSDNQAGEERWVVIDANI